MSNLINLNFFDLTFSLLIIGLVGLVVVRKNVIFLLISLELLLLAVNLNFVFFSIVLDDLVGQIFSLAILTVAAAESAIGLAILVAYYRVTGEIGVEDISLLKG
jgi:NADH-quinone oxidoreductase subunit K